MKSRPEQIDQLLARGRLSGPARERILAQVLRHVEREARPRWSPGALWDRISQTPARAFALALTAAAGAALIFVVQPRKTPHDDAQWREKGAGAPVLMELLCASGDGARCPSGSSLLFRLSGAHAGGYLAAYAEPAETPGERVWYFPAGDGSCPAVLPQAGPQLLRQGVRLGKELPPGRYRVHLLLGSRPLSRQEAQAGARSPAVLAVATAALEVLP